MDKLLPCPFCGSPAEFSYDDDVAHEDEGYGRVRCLNGECRACGPEVFWTEAAVWWNRRPDSAGEGQ